MEIPKSAAHSSLHLFPKLEVLALYDKPFKQLTLPITSTNTPVVDFRLTTDRNIYSDLQRTELKVETNVGTCANGNIISETEVFGATTVPKDGDRFVSNNNKLHSLFSTSDVMINNEMFHTSDNLYAHRTFIRTE